MMREQHVAARLLEGVHSSAGALTLRHVTTIGGVKCRVLLPGPHPGWIVTGAGSLTPPYDEHHEQDPTWPKADWGYINDPRSATIRAVGLIPINARIAPGDELIAFDHAVGRWKHLLRDWLAVTAAGPTDFLEPAWGETLWESPEHDHDLLYANERAGEMRWPQCISRWEWEHSLEHVRSGDQPPLARTLMTTATRAAATGSWRLAVIDAATAAEVALTIGLTARLSAEASPHVAKARIDRVRMLGPRLKLAGDLGMALPATIRADLVEHRNAVVHRGADVTGSHAKAAIAVAWKVVDESEPLPTHCQEPLDRNGVPLYE